MGELREALPHVNMTLESLGSCENRDIKSKRIYSKDCKSEIGKLQQQKNYTAHYTAYFNKINVYTIKV